MSGIWVTTGYIGICRWLGFTYQAYPSSTVKKILEICIIIMLVIDDIYVGYLSHIFMLYLKYFLFYADLITKVLFNEHKHILEWEWPKAFTPYRLVLVSRWYVCELFITNMLYYLPRRRRPGTGDIATPPVRLSVCLSHLVFAL